MSKTGHPVVPPQARQKQSEEVPTGGSVLLAFTGATVCWLLTGAIGYLSPSFPMKDDPTFMTCVFWVPQGFSVFYLGFTAVARGWSTAAACWSVAIIGAAVPLLYGLFLASWVNAATYGFWMAAGLYFALCFEAQFGVVKALEQSIDRSLDLQERQRDNPARNTNNNKDT